MYMAVVVGSGFARRGYENQGAAEEAGESRCGPQHRNTKAAQSAFTGTPRSAGDYFSFLG